MPAKKDNEVLAAAAMAAINLIQQPHVQAQIAQAGSAVVSAMRRKGQKAAEDPSASGEGGRTKKKRRSLKEVATAPVGNQKMERRVRNLSENVRLLRSAVGGEASTALWEVERVVGRLEVAVTMAGNLPMGKRKKAHWEIDSVLDKLERAVFASVME